MTFIELVEQAHKLAADPNVDPGTAALRYTQALFELLKGEPPDKKMDIVYGRLFEFWLRVRHRRNLRPVAPPDCVSGEGASA